MDPQKTIDVVLPAAAFLLIVALWLVGMIILSMRRSGLATKIHRRIGLIEDSGRPERQLRLWHDGKEVTTYVPGMPVRPPAMQRFRRLCQDAGWQTPHTTILTGVLCASGLLGLCMLALLRSPLLALGAPVSLLSVFWIYLKQCATRQEAVFDRQFIDALDLATRSLRAGHPLLGAFRVICDEVPAPVGNVFSEICQQQGVGVGMEEALRRAAAASTSLDLKLFATSVAIQMRTGGNLTDMMERLATVIRSRMWLTRRIRVLTAQTQFSKRLLLVLPFVVFLALNLLNPAYMQPLYTTPLGKGMLMIAGAGLLLGGWAMNRMASLKY